jgi:hypothetical protein
MVAEPILGAKRPADEATDADRSVRHRFDVLEKNRKQQSKGFLTRPPLTDSMTVILGNGQQVYVGIEPESESDRSNTSASAMQASGSLLKEPIAVLIARAEEQRFQETLDLLRAATGKDGADEAAAAAAAAAADDIENHPAVVDTSLWVDKYGPKKFMDLLTDGPAARRVMQWMHEWASAVAGKSKPPEKRVLLLAGAPGMWIPCDLLFLCLFFFCIRMC